MLLEFCFQGVVTGFAITTSSMNSCENQPPGGGPRWNKPGIRQAVGIIRKRRAAGSRGESNRGRVALVQLIIVEKMLPLIAYIGQLERHIAHNLPLGADIP